MFTIYNATLVTVMQVGVIVIGVLASGLWHRFAATSNTAMPFLAGLLYTYGVFSLLIPIAWLLSALLLRRNPSISDEAKGLAFGSGVLLLITLAAFVTYANISPLFHMTWTTSPDENQN
ncbi:MAG TPA: hypothetical protein VGN23_02890 [Verrucomicrobiae bacterium]|jgi:hypothetical protein